MPEEHRWQKPALQEHLGNRMHVLESGGISGHLHHRMVYFLQLKVPICFDYGLQNGIQIKWPDGAKV